MKKKSICLEESIIDLYIKIKSAIYNNQKTTDVEAIKKLNSIIIVDYINTLSDILIENSSFKILKNNNSIKSVINNAAETNTSMKKKNVQKYSSFNNKVDSEYSNLAVYSEYNDKNNFNKEITNNNNKLCVKVSNNSIINNALGYKNTGKNNIKDRMSNKVNSQSNTSVSNTNNLSTNNKSRKTKSTKSNAKYFIINSNTDSAFPGLNKVYNNEAVVKSNSNSNNNLITLNENLKQINSKNTNIYNSIANISSNDTESNIQCHISYLEDIYDINNLNCQESDDYEEAVQRALPNLKDVVNNKNSRDINNNENQNDISYQSSIQVYEKLLQEHESTIRNHIKLEQQLKLHNESLVLKIEELERHLVKIKEENMKYLVEINRYNSDNYNNNILINEIEKLQKIIDSKSNDIHKLDRNINNIQSNCLKYKEIIDVANSKINLISSMNTEFCSNCRKKFVSVLEYLGKSDNNNNSCKVPVPKIINKDFKYDINNKNITLNTKIGNKSNINDKLTKYKFTIYKNNKNANADIVNKISDKNNNKFINSNINENSAIFDSNNDSIKVKNNSYNFDENKKKLCQIETINNIDKVRDLNVPNDLKNEINIKNGNKRNVAHTYNNSVNLFSIKSLTNISGDYLVPYSNTLSNIDSELLYSNQTSNIYSTKNTSNNNEKGGINKPINNELIYINSNNNDTVNYNQNTKNYNASYSCIGLKSNSSCNITTNANNKDDTNINSNLTYNEGFISFNISNKDNNTNVPNVTRNKINNYNDIEEKKIINANNNEDLIFNKSLIIKDTLNNNTTNNIRKKTKLQMKIDQFSNNNNFKGLKVGLINSNTNIVNSNIIDNKNLNTCKESHHRNCYSNNNLIKFINKQLIGIPQSAKSIDFNNSINNNIVNDENNNNTNKDDNKVIKLRIKNANNKSNNHIVNDLNYNLYPFNEFMPIEKSMNNNLERNDHNYISHTKNKTIEISNKSSINNSLNNNFKNIDIVNSHKQTNSISSKFKVIVNSDSNNNKSSINDTKINNHPNKNINSTKHCNKFCNIPFSTFEKLKKTQNKVSNKAIYNI